MTLRHMETNVHKGAAYFASCRSSNRPAKHREADIKSEFTTKKDKKGQVQEQNQEAKALWKEAQRKKSEEETARRPFKDAQADLQLPKAWRMPGAPAGIAG